MKNKQIIRTRNKKKEGAALLIVLGIVMILSMIVLSSHFEAQLEMHLVSYKRKRFHAKSLAHSGLEYAKAILDNQSSARELEIEDMDEDQNGFMQTALYVQRGLSASSTIEMNDGSFSITIEPAESGRNVNLLNRQQWTEIFEMANVPSTDWDAMVDCLEDWIDENDTHGLNGAESDDPFYEDQGYPVKNGALDSVEELLMIKNWGPEILYGRPADEDNDAIYGIADILTVWGDGKVNLNSASTNLLLSFAEYEDWELASVFEARAGEDGEFGTIDDGIKSLESVGADSTKFKLQSDFVRVTSEGESFGNKYRIECIFLLKNQNSVVVYWEEGPVK
ncbi:MAG: general secretion pathway protein GspK [Pontiellaceae bacterium]|nr:general secretion pathway protein GspK [Pontiellaceae bacterium]MBN2785303.1 general secretion pathway protein GspK [Pontiellaceae bacterium]